MDKKPLNGKYLDFTKQEITDYLDIFKQLVSKGRYTISKNANRQENIDFMMDYRINSYKVKEILMNLQYDDFCYAAANYNLGYEHERLYVFCKEYELDYWGELEYVDIYIKTNIIQIKDDNFAIVISFHKRNEPITYLFRK